MTKKELNDVVKAFMSLIIIMTVIALVLKLLGSGGIGDKLDSWLGDDTVMDGESGDSGGDTSGGGENDDSGGASDDTTGDDGTDVPSDNNDNSDDTGGESGDDSGDDNSDNGSDDDGSGDSGDSGDSGSSGSEGSGDDSSGEGSDGDDPVVEDTGDDVDDSVSSTGTGENGEAIYIYNFDVEYFYEASVNQYYSASCDGMEISQKKGDTELILTSNDNFPIIYVEITFSEAIASGCSCDSGIYWSSDDGTVFYVVLEESDNVTKLTITLPESHRNVEEIIVKTNANTSSEPYISEETEE